MTKSMQRTLSATTTARNTTSDTGTTVLTRDWLAAAEGVVVGVVRSEVVAAGVVEWSSRVVAVGAVKWRVVAVGVVKPGVAEESQLSAYIHTIAIMSRLAS